VAEKFKQPCSKVAQTDSPGAPGWREMLGRGIPQIYRMFMRRWPNRSLAEELVQKTVFDAVRARQSHDPAKGSFENWLMAIARNNFASEMRQRAARPSMDGDIAGYLEAIDSEPLPDEVLEKKETARIVRRAMDELESKERDVLRGKYIDDLSARAIAQKMEMTEKAVHSLLYRARNSLRKKLKNIGPLYNEVQKS
jgi:RNA polymerase sigma-70 factor (ECF subfamily)